MPVFPAVQMHQRHKAVPKVVSCSGAALHCRITSQLIDMTSSLGQVPATCFTGVATATGPSPTRACSSSRQAPDRRCPRESHPSSISHGAMAPLTTFDLLFRKGVPEAGQDGLVLAPNGIRGEWCVLGQATPGPYRQAASLSVRTGRRPRKVTASAPETVGCQLHPEF
jgi:hypothetical protein